MIYMKVLMEFVDVISRPSEEGHAGVHAITASTCVDCFRFAVGTHSRWRVACVGFEHHWLLDPMYLKIHDVELYFCEWKH